MSSEVTVLAPDAAALVLLARVFAGEIDDDLLGLLQDRGVVACLEQCEPDCAPVLASRWGPAELEAAAVEYCRLFIVPQVAAPLASAWLAGNGPNAGARIAALVDTLVATAELELPPEIAALPRDHVAVLLLITAWLMEHRRSVSGDFVERALVPWAGRFAAVVTAQAELPLYRAFGRFLAAVL